MRRISLLRDCALVLCCTLLVVPIVSGRTAQPPAAPAGQGIPTQGQVHFYFCASNQIGRGHTAYISNIFAVSKQNSPPIENEYLGFLKKRYSYPARETACFDGYQTEEEARAARQTRIKQFDQIEDKVVETPWTYSAALSDDEIHPQPTRVSPPPAPSSRVQGAVPKAAPAATAAQPSASAAAAAGQSVPAQAQNRQDLPYICSATLSDRQTSRTTFYRTGVFQSAASPNDAWDTYVRKTYHHTDYATIQCIRAPSDPAGQQYTLTYMEQSPQAHKAEIVHVDWKYTPDQAAPAATAAQPSATAAAGQGTPPVGLVANYYCFANFDQNSPNNYASGLYAGPKSVNTVIMAKDFAQFVKEKYQSGERGKKVTGDCYNAPIDKAVAEAGKAQFESRWRSDNKWIETGWKPTTTPVASDKGKPYYCFGYNNNKSLYFSDTFEVPPNTPANPVIVDFGQFLTEKYGLSFRTGWAGGIRCSWGDKAKFVPEPGMAGYKIIETGWKPKSLPPPYTGP